MSDHFGKIPIQSSTSTPKTPGEKSTLSIEQTSNHESTPVKQSSRKEKRRRPKLLPFWFIIFVISLLLYNCIGFFVVPYYLTKILPNKIKAETGFTISTSSITFNPLLFKLDAGPLNVHSPQNEKVLSFTSLHTDIAPIPLLRSDFICNSLRIEGFEATVIRDLSNQYNFKQFFSQPSDEEESEIIAFSDLPFFFSLNNISIIDGSVIFKDLPKNKNHTLKEINLNLPTLSNIKFQADKYIQPYFSAVINGSPFELSGQTRAGYGSFESGITELSCDLKNLDLKMYSEYLPFDLPFKIESGTGSGKIDLHFDPDRNKEDKLAINFDFKLNKLRLQHNTPKTTFTTENAVLRGSYQPVSNNLVISEIVTQNPKVTLSKLLTFKSSVDNESQSGLQKDGTVEVKPFSFIVTAFTLIDGEVAYQNRSKKESAVWSNVQVLAKNVHNHRYSEKSEISQAGAIDISATRKKHSSTLHYIGTVDEQGHLSGELGLKNTPVSDLLQLVVKEEKVKPIEGIGSLNGKLSLKRNRLSGQFHPQLSNTNLIVNNLNINFSPTTFLQAKKATFGTITEKNNSINLGSVIIKDGKFILEPREFDTHIYSYTEKKLLIESFEFQGSLHFPITGDFKKKIDITGLTLKATNLLDNEKPDNFSFSGTVTDSGSLQGLGKLSLSPTSLSVKTEFANLTSDDISYFLKTEKTNNTNRLVKGDISGKGNFIVPGNTFTGYLKITDGVFTFANSTNFSWETLELNNLLYSSHPFQLTSDKISLYKPLYSWTIKKKDDKSAIESITNTVKAYLVPPANKPKKEETGKQRIDIKSIVISNGTIDIRDERLEPEWSGSVTQVQGRIEQINTKSDSPDSRIFLKSEFDDSDLEIRGEVNISKENLQSSLNLELSHYPLASFHKQLFDKLDIDTSKGSFSVKSLSTIDGQRRNTSGQIIFHNLSAHDNSSPTALSLALLADVDDTIAFDFNADISGKENNSIFSEIYTSLQTTFVKGLISPLLLADGDFTDLIDVNRIEFNPGEFVVTDNGRHVLTRLNQLLKQHPFLGLKLSGGLNMPSDRTGLRSILQQREDKRVETLNKERLEAFNQRKQKYEAELEKQQVKDRISGTISETQIPEDILLGFQPVQPMEIEVDDAMLLTLAQRRLEYVEDFFRPLTSLQFDRIHTEPPTIDPATQQPGNTGITFHLKAVDK